MSPKKLMGVALTILVAAALPSLGCSSRQADGGVTPPSPATDAVPGGRGLDNRVVGYARRSLGNLPALAASVDLRKLTHLIITFANPNDTSPLALSSSDADVAVMVSAAHAAGIEVLVSIGGSTGTVRVLPQLVPDKVQPFVQTVVDFADAHDFDGVDVDVESAAIVPADYEALVLGLHAALKPKKKLLTAAVAGSFDHLITDVALSRFDFVQVMAYSLRCTDAAPPPCEHSPYDRAVLALEHFVNDRKLAPASVLLGVPFYGRCWGAACGGAGDIPYAEILDRFPGAEAMDRIDLPDMFLTYNGRATIERKAKLARGYGGIFFWHLAADAPAPHSLLDVIAASF